MVKVFHLLIFVSIIGCSNTTNNEDSEYLEKKEENLLVNQIEVKEIEEPNSIKCLTYKYLFRIKGIKFIY